MLCSSAVVAGQFWLRAQARTRTVGASMSELRGPPLEMDPDEAVQSTNDDAQASKASCVQAGYFRDDFIQYFVKKKGVQKICCNSSIRCCSMLHQACKPITLLPWSPVAADMSLQLLGLHVHHEQLACAVRKAPLINRGYYTRHRCMSALIARFRSLCEKSGHGCQLLNLGAGFDTTYWQLKHQVGCCYQSWHAHAARVSVHAKTAFTDVW